ncbi:DUF2971 domain-containing protein [Raoultella terrigena]|uniref:DUF2971 domain-containing protein n=1 Tax=Raoultella terrigena TaxID=577 RepID=UPI001330AEEE|nr:DUF2971 domain-containing protein [Raoultella terrigena]
MLVKYLGTVFDENKKRYVPRLSFLQDGLFRITQPKFLNDQGSEFRMYPYFNKFSPADYLWARKQYDKRSDGVSIPSKELLENVYLKPMGLRYDDAFPEIVKCAGFQSMEQYDDIAFKNSVGFLNNFLVEFLSCHLGVFSLCNSDVNENMWTHYASEGKGIAVTFYEEHPYFKQNIPVDVTYRNEDRVSVSYYHGCIRINGERIEDLHPKGGSILNTLYNPFFDYNFYKQLICSKSYRWSVENEKRIIFDLASRDAQCGEIVFPALDESIKHIFQSFLNSYPVVCLKKFPFDAIESIVIGFSVSIDIENEIKDIVKNNNKLSHIQLKRAKYDVFGEINTVNVTS